MSTERITDLLVEAFSLLDFSERIVSELIELCNDNDSYRLLKLLEANIRDAKKYVNDAEVEFDSMIKELDETEEQEIIDAEELSEALEKLAREASRAGVMFL